jgi:hypothetical protein
MLSLSAIGQSGTVASTPRGAQGPSPWQGVVSSQENER